MTTAAATYLANLVTRLQEEHLAAIRNDRANDHAAYFWGFKEGMELAVNIAAMHQHQYQRSIKEATKARDPELYEALYERCNHAYCIANKFERCSVCAELLVSE